jgi:hypothetical protein
MTKLSVSYSYFGTIFCTIMLEFSVIEYRPGQAKSRNGDRLAP